MKLCRYIVALSLVIILLAPGSVLAARARKSPPSPVTHGDVYQNKPIAPGGTVWYCVSSRSDILCLLGDRGDQEVRPRQAVDARLPTLVDSILNSPEELAGSRIRIPLHSEPFDFQLVGQLAEAVMCGSNKRCGVIFAETLPELRALVRSFEILRQASWPVPPADNIALAGGAGQ